MIYLNMKNTQKQSFPLSCEYKDWNCRIKIWDYVNFKIPLFVMFNKDICYGQDDKWRWLRILYFDYYGA